MAKKSCASCRSCRRIVKRAGTNVGYVIYGGVTRGRWEGLRRRVP